MKLIPIIIFLLFTKVLFSQPVRIPASYTNLRYDKNDELYFYHNNKRYYSYEGEARYKLEQLFGNPVGTKRGLLFDFNGLKGDIIFGLIPYGLAPHPTPVYRFKKKLLSGKVSINITRRFGYPYNFVHWNDTKYLSIGYRVLNELGQIIYDGVVSVSGSGPFTVVPSIYEGPFVSKVTDHSAVIWFNATKPMKATVEVDGRTFSNRRSRRHLEFEITGLEPDTKYDYVVKYGPLSQQYHFKTALKKGSKKAFVFAYTSDSRRGYGGGERDIFGTNAYITKKMAAVAYSNGAEFVQFTGDMVNGYLSSLEEMKVQFSNWKKAVEPFWHYIPFNVAMGNHEFLGYMFFDDDGNHITSVDGFPYKTYCAEAAFGDAFVNPTNGPVSEDSCKYDIRLKRTDFPSYKENVYYYVYANIAMIVLNSDYWYAPYLKRIEATSGGLHGYIMDRQLEWLKNVIEKLEEDNDIDHIFVTIHTPVFPNGGHSGDDMWYRGNNEFRPYISGKPVDKGIIQRRDEFLDILINKSSKVVAVLTGDEHNYNRLELTSEVPIYPENYPYEKIEISRPIYQINNGACGAPYYAQEKLPWSEYTKAFSVENAVCLFYINGKKVDMKVINPDTLNEIDEIELK